MELKLPKGMIQKNAAKVCNVCERNKRIENFPPTKTLIYPDGHAPICNDCIKDELEKSPKMWDTVDYFCRVFDLPFIPKRWREIEVERGTAGFPYYARLMQESTYDGLGWRAYNEAYLELEQNGLLELEVPLVAEKELEQMRIEWGSSYTSKQLVRLNNLYERMKQKQNVVGGVGEDVARKLCVLSLLIDENLANGGEGLDKLVNSYKNLAAVGDLTPKNARSDGDLSSMGEIAAWLERRGWMNKWYDGYDRDVIDEIMTSLKAFNQRLYTHESGLSEDIEDRIENLRQINEMEKESRRKAILQTKDNFFLSEDEEKALIDLDQQEVNLLDTSRHNDGD